MFTVVLVEPRTHKALEFVVQNLLENLSSEWTMILYHGNLNLAFVTDIRNRSPFKERIQLVGLPCDNLTREQYSNLMMRSFEFYSYIQTEYFLVAQTDSMILNKHLLNEFLFKYDYVGAPWTNHRVGNGGFSLRRKSKMIEIMEKQNFNYHLPEDVYFSQCKVVKVSLPNYETAKRFSIENVFSNDSFACHQPWLLKSAMLAHFPQTAILMTLNDRLN